MITVAIPPVHLAVFAIFAVLLVRAEEAWEPVLFGGLIPMAGAIAIGYLIYHAVRENDEDDADQDQDS